jgi:hypothetical protein
LFLLKLSKLSKPYGIGEKLGKNGKNYAKLCKIMQKIKKIFGILKILAYNNYLINNGRLFQKAILSYIGKRGSFQCLISVRLLKRKIEAVDVQGLIDESFLSPDTHLKGDPIKTAEAVKTGETN